MPEPTSHDPSKETGMRAMGDQDRSPETKEMRAKFLDRISETLADLSRMQKEKKLIDIAGGLKIPIETEPRIRHTNLGKTALGFRAVGVDKKMGACLYGDGETSPHVFEYVGVDTEGSPVTIQINGRDPLHETSPDGTPLYRAGKRFPAVASLRIEKAINADDSIIDMDTTYSVLGDGAVGISEHGQTQFQPRDFAPFDQKEQGVITTAHMALEDIRNTLGLTNIPS